MSLFHGRYRIESARLRGWDYSTAAWYFLTICTKDRLRCFGEIKDGGLLLSVIGTIAHQYLADIPAHFDKTEVDEFIVMPDHVHAIVVVGDDGEDTPVEREVGTEVQIKTLQCNVSTGTNDGSISGDRSMSRISPTAASLAAIVRSYKAAVTYWCHHNGFRTFAWQPRFHDRIIRDYRMLLSIRSYIRNNPHQQRSIRVVR